MGVRARSGGASQVKHPSGNETRGTAQSLGRQACDAGIPDIG